MAYLTILTLPLRTEWQKLEIASYKVRIAWQTHNSDKNVLHSRIKSELQEKKSIARYYIQFIFHNFKKKSEMLTIEMKSELRKIDNYHVLFLFSGENMPFIHMTFFFFFWGNLEKYFLIQYHLWLTGSTS